MDEMKTEKQNEAIIKTLQDFLSEFNCAFYALSEPVKQLEKYFNFFFDWEAISVYLKTPEWEFSHWYILDVDIADLQSIINWLKKYSENILRHVYHLDA